MKHLQHPSKHLQHTYETPETLKNIRLQHAYYATFQIYFCNIQMKHLKYMFETPKTYACNMKHMLATCVYSHCNIRLKHLKHDSVSVHGLLGGEL